MRIIDRIIGLLFAPAGKRATERRNCDGFRRLEERHVEKLKNAIYKAGFGIESIATEANGFITYFKVIVPWDFTDDINMRIAKSLPDKLLIERMTDGSIPPKHCLHIAPVQNNGQESGHESKKACFHGPRRRLPGNCKFSDCWRRDVRDD